MTSPKATLPSAAREVKLYLAVTVSPFLALPSRSSDHQPVIGPPPGLFPGPPSHRSEVRPQVRDKFDHWPRPGQSPEHRAALARAQLWNQRRASGWPPAGLAVRRARARPVLLPQIESRADI